MATKRPWHCYRKWENRPYQYKRSSNRRREFARGGAQSKINRFWNGAKDREWSTFEIVVGLKVDKQVQISSSALEAMRVAVNAKIMKKIGVKNYRLRIRPKPFHKIRENKMLAFAGADRVQSGMRNSFGRATTVAARVKAGQVVLELALPMKFLDFAKKRLQIASAKLPCSCQTVLLKYKTAEILKRAGLPLYDVDKRMQIPLYKVEIS